MHCLEEKGFSWRVYQALEQYTFSHFRLPGLLTVSLQLPDTIGKRTAEQLRAWIYWETFLEIDRHCRSLYKWAHGNPAPLQGLKWTCLPV